MVLYTPLAFEDVFPNPPDETPLMEMWVDGRLCLVRRGPDGMPRLERLLSTDPEDYWDPAYQPDTLIRF